MSAVLTAIRSSCRTTAGKQQAEKLEKSRVCGKDFISNTGTNLRVPDGTGWCSERS